MTEDGPSTKPEASPDGAAEAAADSQATNTEKPKKSKNRRARRLVLFGIAAAAAIGLIDVADQVWTFYGKSSLKSHRTVVVERGSTIQETAELFESLNVILSDKIFVMGARLYGADRELKAGEYLIPEGASMYDVMRQLQEGKSVLRRLTVPEGLSVKQIVALLEAEDALTGEIPAAPTPAEGTLLPETYHISLGDTRLDILGRMTTAMDEAIAPLWETREPGLPINSMAEALVLASIVEKETGVASERPHVAGVFINRLRKGMPLQSDPTIVYGITEGVPLGRPIRQSELDAKTPYNTYHFKGLPPTPIANPGIESIKAVLNPMKTEDLYFVADGTGGHVFAKTYREHQQNVRNWRRLQRVK